MANIGRRRFVISGAAVALLLGGIAAWFAFVHQSPPDSDENQSARSDDESVSDPRLTFDTPFRNVKPDVRYVGDSTCSVCHFEIDQKYHNHPMGRSAETVTKATAIERYDLSAHNPCKSGPYELFVEKTNDEINHRVRANDALGKSLPDYVAKVDLVIGSGTRGRSYIHFERGAAWQTAISWYGPESRWDLSPGFDLGNGGRRPIVKECLFCHVNQVEPVAHSANRYKEPFPVGKASIGCERCHGPGELHVAERTAGPPPKRIDTSIVNPKHLKPELQAGICAQCHLQGEQRVARRGRSLFEYRPGLPLEEFVSVFVRHPDVTDFHRSVGQFEQMQVSRCFSESEGRLVCTSCHDPHSTPPAATRERFFADKCQACHGQNSRMCSEKPAIREMKQNSCIACHMPKSGSSNIVHTSVSDHRVPIRPIDATKNVRSLMPGTVPLVPYPIGQYISSGAELDRDLGIAMSRVLSQISTDDMTVRQMLAKLADERLTASVSRRPSDVPAWLALFSVRQARGDQVGALESATKAQSLAPDSEEAYADTAASAAAAGKFELAIEAGTKLIRMNPSSVEPLLLRAGIFLEMRRPKDVEADCKAALAIHPLHPRARLLLAVSLQRSGDSARARRELETALELTTNQRQRNGFVEMFRVQSR